MKTSNQFKLVFLVIVILSISLTSCETDEPGVKIGKEATVLACDYFKEDRVLTNDPDKDVDYIITCVMKINGTDIKIEPGVVIEFEENAGIEIDGFNASKASLSAVGTNDKPIIFRGVKKEAGYWSGIFFNSNSANNKLTHARVEDAGGTRFNSNGDLGAVHVYANGKLTMENTHVTNSKSYGLNAVYGNADITLNNNKFTGNNAPAIIAPPYLNAMNATNDYKGNTSDFVEVRPYTYDIKTNSTWHKINVSYRVNTGTVKHLRVQALLTIQPGVNVEWGSEMELFIYEDGGGLKAVGTSSEPIIFTGQTKNPKSWKGISVYSKHSANEIAHMEIHHSGLGAPQGNVWLWYESFLNIHDVKFKSINGCAINFRTLTGKTSNPNLTIGSNITVDGEGCVSKVW